MAMGSRRTPGGKRLACTSNRTYTPYSAGSIFLPKMLPRHFSIRFGRRADEILPTTWLQRPAPPLSGIAVTRRFRATLQRNLGPGESFNLV